METDPKPQWGIIISGILLVVILIASGVAVVGWIGSNSSDATTLEDSGIVRDERRTIRDQVGRTVYTPVNPAGDVFERDEPDEDALVSFTSRPDVEWQRLSGQTERSASRDYPFSAVAGPWKVTDGVAHGFARTPQGAALAGIHMLNGLAQGGVEAAKVSRQFVDDPVTVEMAEFMIANPDGTQLPEMPWSNVFVAYSILDYDGDTSRVRYGLADGENFASWDVEVHWADDEWKMHADSVADTTEPVSESQIRSWVQL